MKDTRNKVIYTTYFNNLENLPDNVIPISICSKAPDWWTGRQYKKLAPKYDFFKKWKENHDNAYYIACFSGQVLSKLNPTEVIGELFRDIPDGCTIALVCYEKPDEFCHRHLVAEWFQSVGYVVKEYMAA